MRPFSVHPIIPGLFFMAALLVAGASIALPMAPYTDHSGEDHSSEDHNGEDLTGINLTSADLTDTSFKDAILTNAILIAANLTDADLKDADLTGANLSNAVMTDVGAKDAIFTNAILDGVSFSSGDIKHATFVGASLLGADLSGLDNADDADFTGALYDAATQLAAGMDTTGMILVVPEPSSAILLVLGLIGLEFNARRFGRDRAAARDHAAALVSC